MAEIVAKGTNSIFYQFLDRMGDKNVYPKEWNVVPFFPKTATNTLVFLDFLPSEWNPSADTFVRILVNDREITPATGTKIENASGLIYCEFKLDNPGIFRVTLKSVDLSITYRIHTFNAKNMHILNDVYGSELGDDRTELEKVKNDQYWFDVRDAQISDNFARLMEVDKPIVFNLDEFRLALLGDNQFIPGLRRAFLRAGTVRGVKDVARSMTGIDPIIRDNKHLWGFITYGPGKYGTLPKVYPAMRIPYMPRTAVSQPYQFRFGGTPPLAPFNIVRDGVDRVLHIGRFSSSGYALGSSGFYRDNYFSDYIPLNNANGWTVEWKVNLKHQYGPLRSCVIQGSDGVVSAFIMIALNYMWLGYIDNGGFIILPVVIPMDLQDNNYHTFRLTVKGTTATAYLDNAMMPVASLTIPATLPAGTKNCVSFGRVFDPVANDFANSHYQSEECLVKYFAWCDTRDVAVSAYDAAQDTFPYVDEELVDVEQDIETTYDPIVNPAFNPGTPGNTGNLFFPLTGTDALNGYSEDLVATTYDGRFLDFTINLLVRQSIRTVFAEPVLRQPQSFSLTDSLNNTYVIPRTGWAFDDPVHIYLNDGSGTFYTEGVEFTVDRVAGTITWNPSGPMPGDRATYYVDYKFYMKDIIIPLIERVKPSVLQIIYSWA